MENLIGEATRCGDMAFSDMYNKVNEIIDHVNQAKGSTDDSCSGCVQQESCPFVRSVDGCGQFKSRSPGMTFTQAVEGVKESKKVRRQCWNSDEYMYNNGKNQLFKYCDGSCVITWLDFEATDWEILE